MIEGDIIYNSLTSYPDDLWQSSFWKAMVHDMRTQFGEFLIIALNEPKKDAPRGKCPTCARKKSCDEERWLEMIEKQIDEERKRCPCEGCKTWRANKAGLATTVKRCDKK